MRFKADEQVKVILGNDNGKPIVRDGTYVEYLQESDGHRVQVASDRVLTLPNTSVYKHDYLPNGDEDAENCGLENIKLLCDHWDHAANELLKERDRGYKVVDGHTLSLVDGCVTVEPAIITQRRIGKFVELPGWSVTEWTFENNYPHAPDESIDNEVGRSANVHEVVKIALQAVFRALMVNYYNCEWSVPDARDA